MRTLARGQGRPDWPRVPRRLLGVLLKTGTFSPVFQRRFTASLFHGLVGWGFIYYLLVNLGDVLQALLPDFHFLGTGRVNDLYRLGGDLLSVGVLVGMLALIVRRFVLRPQELSVRDATLLNPKARAGIRRSPARW